MKKLFAMTVAVLLLFSVLLGIPAAYGQAPETGKRWTSCSATTPTPT